MPRPKHLTPKSHLHITLDAELRAKLDATVWSDLEGKIPAAALQRFIEARLREYFTDVRVDLAGMVLGAGVVSGSPGTITALLDHLENLERSQA